jgi:hypothetical protein
MRDGGDGGAMWNTSVLNEGCHDPVANLLVATLRSVLYEAEILQDLQCEQPVIEPGSENHEIIEQLTQFRLQVKEVERREAMIITGVARARTWAQTLRQMAPGLRPEIDTFRLATSQCSVLQEAWLPNLYDIFNGGKRPQNYLDQRYRKIKWADGSDGGADYEVCGKVSVSEIVFACEALLTRLEPQYEAIEQLEVVEQLEDQRASNPISQPSASRPLTLELVELAPDETGVASEEESDKLDASRAVEGIETLLDLESRAEETMRMARVVQARAPAQASSLDEPAGKPAEEPPAKTERTERARRTRFSLFDEIALPVDSDDLFGGVPGVDLGHA